MADANDIELRLSEFGILKSAMESDDRLIPSNSEKDMYSLAVQISVRNMRGDLKGR